MEAAKPLDWKAYPGAPDVGEAREYYGFFEFGYYVVTKDGGSWSASTFMNDGKAKHVGFFGTLAEAKGAAESDYHSRLRSAFQPAPPEPITLTYTNWRGETAARTLIPLYVWFGATEWHPSPQWLLRATDTAKAAERDFALKDFGASSSEAEKNGVGIGMAVAAGIIMSVWGDTVHAGEILTAAGFHSADDLRAAGVEDYDINLVREALKPRADA